MEKSTPIIQTMKSFKRVSFEDCDPFSHLNNANYLNYFLNAREEQLRSHQVLDIFDHARQTGCGWAVISHDIRYLRPAKLGEELEIWSRMLTHDAFINLIEFVMVSKASCQLKSVTHTRLAYFSIKTSKPVRHSDHLNTLFDKLSLYPEKKIQDFSIDSRMKHLKKEVQLN
jgi:YbgC/YbaW family acyl-CoA thioester hydrolase